MTLDATEIGLDLRTATRWCDHVFRECRRVAENPDLYDFPSLALFRHMIQMAEAIEILLSAGTSTPTRPLLRSMLESLLSLMYIHGEQYQRRSLCWLCSFIHQEIKIKEMIDIDTDKGKQFYEAIAQEFKGWHPRPSRPKLSIKEHIAQWRRHLDRDDMAEIEKEYQGRRAPKWWYSIDNNKLNNNYDLAKHVGMVSFYKLYYQPWSATVHGTDASRLVLKQKDGNAEFKELRFLDTESKDQADLMARIFLLLACRLMVGKFVSESHREKLWDDFEELMNRPDKS